MPRARPSDCHKLAVAGFPKTLAGQVLYSSPAAGQGNIYIGMITPDNKLDAFHAIIGAALAGFPKTLGGAIESSPGATVAG